MANAFRAKNQRAFKPKDFMPDFGGDARQPQTVREMQMKMAMSFGIKLEDIK